MYHTKNFHIDSYDKNELGLCHITVKPGRSSDTFRLKLKYANQCMAVNGVEGTYKIYRIPQEFEHPWNYLEEDLCHYTSHVTEVKAGLNAGLLGGEVHVEKELID